MLGHDHVADEKKFVARAHSVQNFDEAVAHADSSEKRSAAVTTEGAEVKIAASIVAPKGIAHASRAQGKVNPRTLKPEGYGTLAYVKYNYESCVSGILLVLIRQGRNHGCATRQRTRLRAQIG
jgi:hypothetical protein